MVTDMPAGILSAGTLRIMVQQDGRQAGPCSMLQDTARGQSVDSEIAEPSLTYETSEVRVHLVHLVLVEDDSWQAPASMSNVAPARCSTCLASSRLCCLRSEAQGLSADRMLCTPCTGASNDCVEQKGAA